MAGRWRTSEAPPHDTRSLDDSTSTFWDWDGNHTDILNSLSIETAAFLSTLQADRGTSKGPNATGSVSLDDEGDQVSRSHIKAAFKAMWNDELKAELRAELKQELDGTKKKKGSKVKVGPAPDDGGEDGGGFNRPQKRASVFDAIVDDELELEESVWTSGFLLFTPAVGMGTSIFVSFLLIVNMAVQGLFIQGILPFSAATFTDDSIEELKRWRMTIAHDISNYNVLTHETLAQRVCADDNSLSQSGVQAGTYSELVAYLGEGDGFGTSDATGPLLCICALILWVLTVGQEFNSMANTLRCVLVLSASLGGYATSNIDLDIEGKLKIKSLSMVRKLFCCAILVVRCVLCGFLAYCGCLWLVYTTDVTDLILNAAALEFIMSVDELIFSGLAPQQAQSVRSEAHPLKAPSRKKYFGGVDLYSIFMLALTSSILGASISILVPHTSLLVQARDAICAGDQQFVMTRDGCGVPVWGYPGTSDAQKEIKATMVPRNYPDGKDSKSTKDYNLPTNTDSKGLNQYTNKVVEAALQQLGRDYWQDGKNDFCNETDCFDSVTDWSDTTHETMRADAKGCCYVQSVVPTVDSGTFSILAKSTETAIDGVRTWNPTCRDTLNLYHIPYTKNLRGAVMDASDNTNCAANPCNMSDTPMCLPDGTCVKPDCDGIGGFCHEDSLLGTRARQLCPQTCGCDDPHSHLVLSLPQSGCGDMCERSGHYIEAITNLPCTDVVKTDTKFKAFLEEVTATVESWPVEWKPIVEMIVEDLGNHGCDYLTWGSNDASLDMDINIGPWTDGLNLCTEGGTFFPIKPLSYWCPEACNCRKGDPHCSSQCPTRQAGEPMCPDYMKVESFEKVSQERNPDYMNDFWHPNYPDGNHDVFDLDYFVNYLYGSDRNEEHQKRPYTCPMKQGREFIKVW